MRLNLRLFGIAAMDDKDFFADMSRSECLVVSRCLLTSISGHNTHSLSAFLLLTLHCVRDLYKDNDNTNLYASLLLTPLAWKVFVFGDNREVVNYYFMNIFLSCPLPNQTTTNFSAKKNLKMGL